MRQIKHEKLKAALRSPHGEEDNLIKRGFAPSRDQRLIPDSM